MNYSKLTTTYFSLIIILFVSVSADSPRCFGVQCNQSEPIIIRTPFWIPGRQPKSCGYQRFSLSCDDENRTILNLPQSGKFKVESINFAYQSIELSDPDNCLARKVFSLSLSTTPFQRRYYYYDAVFTFFNCSRVDSAYKAYVIPCLSGSNYTVTATSSEYVARRFLATDCKVIKNVTFLGSNSKYFSPSDIFYGNLVLSWNIPYCDYCEGGRCDYKNSSTLEMACTNKGAKGILKLAVILFAGFFLPLLCCIMGIRRMFTVFTRTSLETRADEVVNNINNNNNNNNNTASSTVIGTTAIASTAIASTGLDTDTLNSYSKRIIGESGRLPNPEDDICSICMSMYKPKDTIKSIPECSHYFHVDCIDKWLCLNATCPVCRKSPLQKTL